MIKFPWDRRQPVFLFATDRIFACNRGNVILRGTLAICIFLLSIERVIKSAPFSCLFTLEPTHTHVFCSLNFFRSFSRLTSAAYFRTCSHWHSLKPHLYSSPTNFSSTRREKEKGERGWKGGGGGRGQLSQTCSRRNNRWLLNRKHTRFLWGRRYRYENVLALRKRTTCLVSSVSFVSRFLPVNKPGLHPPAAARHPSSKHKAL